MDIMQVCKDLYEKWKDFSYGIPVDGKIQSGSVEWWEKNYRLLSPEEFVKYHGGVCWDYVEFGRDYLSKIGGIPFHQFYIVTDTPDYDTHTFIVCRNPDDSYVYVESSFKKVADMIGGYKRFEHLDDILDLITTTMFDYNGNDKLPEFKYDVLTFEGHPPYGSTCKEYMEWMNEHGEMVRQRVAKNPRFIAEESVSTLNSKNNFSKNIDGMNIHLRPATEKDAMDMYTWEMESIDDNLKQDKSVQDNIREDVQSSIKDTAMIMCDDKTIGMFTACMIDDGEFRYIGELYIIESYRGHGIGTAIIEHEIETYDKIKLQVAYSNINAIKLYKSLGFNIIESNDNTKMYVMLYDKENINEYDVFNEGAWNDIRRGVHPHSKKLMFHISTKSDLDEKEMKPQIPSYITDGGEIDPDYPENTTTERICVSPSIEGCLVATISTEKLLNIHGQTFYVYTPEKPFTSYKHKTNKDIIKDKDVFDANLTGESWILEPCKMKLYGTIKVDQVPKTHRKSTVNKDIKMWRHDFKWDWVVKPGVLKESFSESVLVTNEEFFIQEANKNYEKALKILDYDPKTKTIKCDIPDENGGKINRVLMLIDDQIAQYKKDASVSSVLGKKNYLNELLEKTNNPDKIKAIEKELEFLNKYDENEWCITIPKKILKTRNLQNLITVNHELGHIYVRSSPKGSKADDQWDQIQQWCDTRNEYNHASRNVKNFNHAISVEEILADSYAADKVSSQALHKTNDKVYSRARQDIYGFIKKQRKEYKRLKNQLDKMPVNTSQKEYDNLHEQVKNLYQKCSQLWDPDVDKYNQDPLLYVLRDQYVKLKNKLDNSEEKLKNNKLIRDDLNDQLDEIEYILKRYEKVLMNYKIERNTHNTFVNEPSRIKTENYSEALIPNEQFFAEAKLSAEKRNELKDSDFGIPEERMFPLNDEEHVKQAVKMFKHCPDKYKSDLAYRILKKARQFKLDTSGWDSLKEFTNQEVLKYIRP